MFAKKTKNMEKHLPILAFIAYALAVFPQSDFRPGYIIRYDHDTITGEIDYRANRLMATQCTFRLPDGTVNRYTPSDIAAYRFADGKYYETKVWNGRRTFFEVLVKGELCVYFMKDEQGEHYFLEKQELPLVEIPYQTHTRVKDGSTFVRSNEHYGVLNYYTQDAPALRSEIKKMEELTLPGCVMR